MSCARPAVLHLISGLVTGGAERAMLRLIERGLNDTFSSHVISMTDEGTFGVRLRDAGATLHSLHMRQNPLAAVTRLRSIVRTVKPVIAQGWMYHGNFAALAASRLAPGKVPALWNIRQGLDGLATEKPATRQVIRLNRMLSERPTQILYNSMRAREQHEAFGFASRDGLVIPNGFDLDRFIANPAKRDVVRGELGIVDSAVLVGHFARFHPMKDHSGLLRAANVAFRQGLDAHFLLTGRGVSAEAIGLEGLVDAKFRDRFHIFAERSDIPDMMQAIDIYVSSSAVSEGFPNVIGEAMASSRPSIGTDVGDTAYVIGDTGIVIPPSDPGALTEALLSLAGDAERRRALGRAGRQRVEDNFGIQQVVDQYINLYQSILADVRGQS